MTFIFDYAVYEELKNGGITTVYYLPLSVNTNRINKIVDSIENQIDEVSKEIKELYNKLDSHLLSVPGVGVNLAPVILAEIGDINNFDNFNKLLSYTGFIPYSKNYNKKLLPQKRHCRSDVEPLQFGIYSQHRQPKQGRFHLLSKTVCIPRNVPPGQ